jgi:hypothetical protein
MIDQEFKNLVRYVSGLLRSQPSHSWPKARGSAPARSSARTLPLTGTLTTAQAGSGSDAQAVAQR